MVGACGATQGRSTWAARYVRLPMALLALLLLPGRLPADQWINFTSQDGIAGSIVTHILATENGEVWISTLDEGVSRYDSTGWQGFTNGLAGVQVVGLLRASDGSIWVAFLNGGISQYRNDRWLTQSESGNPLGPAWFLVEGADGSIWVGRDTGVSRFDGLQWRDFSSRDAYALGGGKVTSLLATRDGVIWAGTTTGLSRFIDGEWTAVSTSEVPSVRGLLQTSDGSVWVAAFDGSGLHFVRYRDGLWVRFDEGFRANGLVPMVESVDGSIWAGTESGVVRYDGSDWQTFTSADGLAGTLMPSDSPHGFLTASDGSVWVCLAGDDAPLDGKGGVSRYDGGNWTSFTRADGLAGLYGLSITEAADGTIWVGTETGVSQFVGGWRAFPELDLPPTTNADDAPHLFVAADGAVWLVGKGQVARYNGRDWEKFPEADVHIGSAVYATLATSDGAIWASTSDGLSRYVGGLWETFSQSDGLLSHRVNVALEDDDGSLWLGTPMGLMRFDGSAWQPYTRETGIPTRSDHVTRLLRASDGTLWIGTSSGVASFDGMTWQGALMDTSVTALLETTDGTIWVGSRQGVSRFDGAVWESFGRDALGGNGVVELVAAQDRFPWAVLSGDSGVSRFDGEGWEHFPLSGTLLDLASVGITAQSDGSVWVTGSTTGLDRYREGGWRHFTVADGLAGNIVSTVVETSDRVLWASAVGGVSRFDGTIWERFTAADDIGGTQVWSMTEHPDGSLWIITDGGPAQLILPEHALVQTTLPRPPDSPFGGTNFYFEAVGFELGSKRSAPVSYALTRAGAAPDEEDWSPFELANGYEVSLKSGEWTFHLRSRDRYGKIDLTPATATFTVDVTPPTVLIIEPSSGLVPSGDVVVTGAAFDNSPTADLASYSLEFAPGTSVDVVEAWQPVLVGATQPVQVGHLATWNTTGLHGDFVLRLSAVDALGHTSDYSIGVRIVAAIGQVDRANGGYLIDADNTVALYVPPNAIDGTLQLTVTPLTVSQVNMTENEFLRFTGRAYAIDPAETALEKPVSLTLTLDAAEREAVDAGTPLVLYTSPSEEEGWQRLGGTVDLESGHLRVALRELGRVALFEDTSETTGQGPVRRLTAQPRVFDPRAEEIRGQTTISFEVGEAVHAVVRILDWEGDIQLVLLDRRLGSGNHAMLWDGRDADGDIVDSGLYTIAVESGGRTISEAVGVVTGEARMEESFPNPFNPSTVVPFHVAAAGRVRLLIYNAYGQRIRTLVDGVREAGLYRVVWDGTDDDAVEVSSGLYFVRLLAGATVTVQKTLKAK